MTAEQDAGFHRRAIDRPRGAGDRAQDGEREPQRGQDPRDATSGQEVAWNERVPGHGHST